MKIDSRYAPALFGGLLSSIMVTVVSGFLLLQREGVHPGFLLHWVRGFMLTWPVAFPTVLVVAPLVRRVVASLTRESQPG